MPNTGLSARLQKSPRPANLWPWLLFWVGWLLATLVWDASGADLQVMRWLGSAQGFALRDQWWLSTVLHEGVRQVAVLLYLFVGVMVWRPVGVFRQASRAQRLEAAVGITLALLAVNLIKRSSLTSCPWELQAFGGAATYVSHWAWGVADGGGGFCFPGGHASSALAGLAIAVPWLTSAEASRRRRGLQWTGAVLAAGLLLGGVQTLRGAHYPSHTAWTALVCAAAAWSNHGLFVWAQRRGFRRRMPSSRLDRHHGDVGLDCAHQVLDGTQRAR
jgi:membrane-associated PAP2 superfamily phosphatase